MNGLFRPAYRVRVQPHNDATIQVHYMSGSESPVQLVLLLQDHSSLEKSHQILPSGAILVLDMQQATALEIYKQIVKLAETMGWPLPKAGGAQA
jgi:hypothetical protein